MGRPAEDMTQRRTNGWHEKAGRGESQNAGGWADFVQEKGFIHSTTRIQHLLCVRHPIKYWGCRREQEKYLLTPSRSSQPRRGGDQ